MIDERFKDNNEKKYGKIMKFVMIINFEKKVSLSRNKKGKIWRFEGNPEKNPKPDNHHWLSTLNMIKIIEIKRFLKIRKKSGNRINFRKKIIISYLRCKQYMLSRNMVKNTYDTYIERFEKKGVKKQDLNPYGPTSWAE